MAWQTPVTDRTSDSYYNYTDPNRVDNNTQYVEDYIYTNLGMAVTLDTYTSQTVSSLPTPTLINLLTGNINDLKDVIGTPTDWATITADWAAYDTFLFSDANNLEQDLLLLKEMAERIVAMLMYCGAFICGESFDLSATL